MNNSNKELLLRNLEWLYNHDLQKFNFLEAFMKAIVNNDPISVSMSLDSETHIVTVKMGEYMYKEKFDTLEEANEFIESMKINQYDEYIKAYNLSVLKQHNEYVKAYNMLADKLDELGASDDIFEDLSNVCSMALNIDIDEFGEALRYKNKVLAI